jgi:hypothetical protein
MDRNGASTTHISPFLLNEFDKGKVVPGLN